MGYRNGEGLKDGFSIGFEMTVFRLGPPIEKVEVRSEAPYLP